MVSVFRPSRIVLQLAKMLSRLSRIKSDRTLLAFVRQESISKIVFVAMSYRTKKTKKRPTVQPTVRALEHFDVYYKPAYKALWPSIRIALLTARKSAAVINNYSDSSIYKERFLEKGAFDIIERAAAIQEELSLTSEARGPYIDISEKEVKSLELSDASTHRIHDADQADFGDIGGTAFDSTNDNTAEVDRKDIHSFIPVKTVYSDTQIEETEEVKQSIFSPMDVRMDIVKSKKLSLPNRLQVFSFPSGDVSRFPNPKVDEQGGHLCFFMMDASSVLPVIALDLQKGDDVLDLCAAPGGKSLCMLQTGLPDSITCNDISKSRLARLHNILEFHVPKPSREHVTLTKRDGIFFDEGVYDKVLVDVPCNTDRHVLLDNYNNLYSPKRSGERLELPDLQKKLLISAIKSCRRGGSIVYSTCTLSASQNDGIVQQTFDELGRTSDISVVVEDLSEIKQIFRDTFKFYQDCRFGQLVIPSLSANFGPMYICRIKRFK